MIAAVALLAVACSGGQPEAAPTQTPSFDPASLYEGFAACGSPPPAASHDPIQGLVAPPGAILTEVREQDPLVQATGYVELTPLEIRDLFERRDDVELVHIEDEGYEAEVLVDDGQHRTFIKAQILCRTGSRLGLVVAPSGEQDALPQPGQATQQ